MPSGLGYFESEYPKGAHFWDHLDHSYVRLVRLEDKLYVEAYCYIKEKWQIANVNALGLFQSGCMLMKNPSVTWGSLQVLIKDPFLYLVLYEQAETKRPRLPFLRLKPGLVITKSRYLSWWERLYLCYVRGFKRYPDAAGFYFVKNTKGEG
jgi:hypothetical protein